MSPRGLTLPVQVDQLKPHIANDDSTQSSPTFTTTEEEEQASNMTTTDMETIIDHRLSQTGELKLLMKWAHQPRSEATWEIIHHFQGSQREHCLGEYLTSIGMFPDDL